MFKCIGTFGFVVLSAWAAGQVTAVSLTALDGLPAGVTDLEFDASGALWLSSRQGLSRFDGERFEHFVHDPHNAESLSSDNCTFVTIDDAGFIWVGTLRNGLNRFDPRTGAVQRWPFRGMGQAPFTISDPRPSQVTQVNDSLFLVNAHFMGADLINVRSGSCENLLPGAAYPDRRPREINLLTGFYPRPDFPGRYWVTSFDGLMEFDLEQRSFRRIGLYDRMAEGEAANQLAAHMRNATVGPSGKLWIGTWGGGLLEFDPRDERFRVHLGEPLNPVIGSRNFVGKQVLRNDSVIYYAGGTGMGLVAFDLHSRAFKRFDDLSGELLVPKAAVLALHGDLVATYSQQGALYLFYDRPSQFTFEPLPVKPSDVMVSDRDTLFSSFGEEPIVYRKEGSDSRIVPFVDNPDSVPAGPFFVRDLPGGIPMAFGHFNIYSVGETVERFMDTRSIPLEPLEVGHSSVVAAEFEGDSALWIGTKYNAIYRIRLSDRRVQSFTTTKGKGDCPGVIHSDWVKAFLPDGEFVWYATEAGYGRYEIATGCFENWEVASALNSDNFIRGLLRKDEWLWLTTGTGSVLAVDVNDHSPGPHYDAADGLPSQSPRDFLMTDDGTLWISYAEALMAISPDDGTVQRWDAWSGIHSGGYMQEVGDEIWMEQGMGYYRFRPSELRQAHDPLEIYVDRLRASGRLVPVGPSIQLPYELRSFSLHTGIRGFTSRSNVALSYRLSPAESEWRLLPATGEIQYSALASGNYSLELRMVRGATELDRMTLAVAVERPYWQTVWFYVALALVALGIGGIVVRIRQQRRQQAAAVQAAFERKIVELESRALRAQMNPHFLFNSLNSIRLFTLRGDVEEASEYIAKFSQLLRMILNHSRAELISLGQEADALRLYLEFERMRFDRGFSYEVVLDAEEVGEVQVPPLILQTFVENAIWHGIMPRKDQSGHIAIHAASTPESVAITITDNGVGRAQSRALKARRSRDIQEGSLGLRITKERLALMEQLAGVRAAYRIEDLYTEGQPAGTRVHITIAHSA